MEGEALREEAAKVTGWVHDLLQEETSRSLQIRMPEAWVVLAAWMEMRLAMRQRGRHGQAIAGLESPEDLRDRKLARRWLQRTVNDVFHAELHALCTGDHPLLSPPEEEADSQAQDGLPF